MSRCIIALSMTFVLFFMRHSIAANLKSGIAVGESVMSFSPHNVTGPDAGKASCLVCRNGEKPVVAVFAREIDDNLTRLIKKVDEATALNKKKAMGSFVVFLNKTEDMEKRVKELAGKQGLKDIVLALDNPTGPKGYGIAKQAGVTILLYVDYTVRANFAFPKGRMTAADVDRVLRELPKILHD